MKFLPRALDDSKLMMLRTYYKPGSSNFNAADDILDFVYKDIETGKIYIESIPNPKFEVWITKPEYRNYDHYPAFMKKEKCDRYLVPYKQRYSAVGRILGCSPKEAKYSKYVFQLDMDIEHFYMMNFFKEYGYKVDTKPLSIGFSDIESDIINCEGFAKPGEAPTNAISYFDENTKEMFTFVCVQDNLPHLPTNHPDYEKIESLRASFKEQTEYFMDHLDAFKEECKQKFEEEYGEIEYNILVFADELSMYRAYWKILDIHQNDFLFFWNAPYDISNLIERPKTLGADPSDIIVCPEFGHRIPVWHQDNNYMVHKRKHILDTYTKVTPMDQMVNYAGIRSGKGKLPSVKLNAIAKSELKDEKLDYSEYGNIKMFCYENFWLFILYNIKDRQYVLVKLSYMRGRTLQCS